MKVYFSEHFKKQLKKLKKKFPNVKDDLLNKLACINLKDEIYIGKSIYKIRINSTDLSKGKSGGHRSYIYLFQKGSLLVPLCIYHKSQKENISNNELKHYFDAIIEELLGS